MAWLSPTSSQDPGWQRPEQARLRETEQRRYNRDVTRTHIVAGQRFPLDRELVERTLSGELPDPVRDHYVVVAGRRYPPKQVLAAVTGLDRADFTTHQARRILTRLGFVAGRRSRDDSAAALPDRAGPHGGRQAEALRPYVGKWVALSAPTEVLVAADSPQEVLAWLARHGRKAWGMFPVPESAAETEIIGPI